MSRIDDCEADDTRSFLRACAFGHNVEQALKGKKGQKFLRELEAELVAMPEKRLFRGTLAIAPATLGFGVKLEGEVCALGVVAVARAVRKGLSRDEAFAKVAQVARPSKDDEDYENGYQKIEKAAKELGISTPLAYAIVSANDEGFYASLGDDRSPEALYRAMLGWIRAQILPEKVA